MINIYFEMKANTLEYYSKFEEVFKVREQIFKNRSEISIQFKFSK